MTSGDDGGVRVGVLLAGGAARRAGLDKRFFVLEGRTLLVRNLAFLRSLFPTVAVVIGGGQTLDLGDAEGTDVLTDAWPGGSPLIGIATALAHFRCPLFVLASDIAFPQRRAAEAVLAAYPGHDIAVPVIEPDHRQPLFAAYGPACLPPMVGLIESGRHRIIDMFGQVSVARLPFPDESPFKNVNTVEDYLDARRSLSRVSGGGALQPMESPAVVAVTGRSAAASAALIAKLVPELGRLGLRVGRLTLGAHGPSSDRSWGGATLAAVARDSFSAVDLLVVDGDARHQAPCVEVLESRASHARTFCPKRDTMAYVSDGEPRGGHHFAPDDAAGLARFLAVRLDTLRAY